MNKGGTEMLLYGDKDKYLRLVDYNRVRIIQKMLELVEEKGGYAVSSYNKEQATQRIYPRGENITAKQSDENVIYIRHSGYLSVYLDGYIYYFSMDENPFFNDTFYKVKVDDDLVVTNNFYMDILDDKIKHKYMPNEIWSGMLDDYLISMFAEMLLQHLLERYESEKYIDTQRIRVANIYDNGYHWENKVKPPIREQYKKVEYV